MKRAAQAAAGGASPPAAQRKRVSDELPQCLRGIIAASVGLVGYPTLQKLVRARGGELVPLDASARPGVKGVTHIVCDAAPACAPRAAELRARAGVGSHVPLVTRQFITDALQLNTRPDEAAYLIQEDQPRDMDAAHVVTPSVAIAAPGERCDTCRGRLQWCDVGRCLRCTASEPASARAVRLRYRAAHPHNRELVAAFSELYELELALLEVARTGGAPDKLNAAEAFSRAAAVFKAAPRPLLDEESVADANLPYVGDKIRQLAAEFLATRTMARLEQLRRHSRTMAVAKLMRIPWVGAAAATAWALKGARCAADVRNMDAEGTLEPPLPRGRALQRVAVEHAEELSVAVPREDWAPVRAVCEQVIAAVDPTADVHIAGGYGRNRAECFDLDYLIAPQREGDEIALRPRLLEALGAHPDVDWLVYQHHSAPEPGALAALRTEAHRARKLEAAGQLGEPAAGVVSNIDQHDKTFCLLQLRGQPCRRVDFIVAPRSQWAFCVIGWAGSRRFERFLRLWAADVRAPLLRLNSHCAFWRHDAQNRIATLSGSGVPLERAQADYIDAGSWPRSERDIFETMLGLPYRPPEDRDA